MDVKSIPSESADSSRKRGGVQREDMTTKKKKKLAPRILSVRVSVLSSASHRMMRTRAFMCSSSLSLNRDAFVQKT